MVSPRRFEVWLCSLDPTVGQEISKTRPAVIVSPDEANTAVSWCTVAPMTTGAFAYATRVPVTFDGKSGVIVVDQLRALDRRRLVRRLGVIDAATQDVLLRTLAAFFAP
jgi:mRNA interferase MazF